MRFEHPWKIGVGLMVELRDHHRRSNQIQRACRYLAVNKLRACAFIDGDQEGLAGVGGRRQRAVRPAVKSAVIKRGSLLGR